jgi:hypothetical protein
MRADKARSAGDEDGSFQGDKFIDSNLQISCKITLTDYPITVRGSDSYRNYQETVTGHRSPITDYRSPVTGFPFPLPQPRP